MTTPSTARQRLQIIIAAGLLATSGCATIPDQGDQTTLVQESESALEWFSANVDGLGDQVDASGGFIVLPRVSQYGTLFGGGTFGRGAVFDSDRRQVGWAYVNTPALGLQVGLQTYKMLIVFEDEATALEFRRNKLAGGVAATAVLGKSDRSAQSAFSRGVAIYQGGATGAMVGVNVGLSYIRFKPIEPADETTPGQIDVLPPPAAVRAP